MFMAIHFSETPVQGTYWLQGDQLVDSGQGCGVQGDGSDH